MKIYPDPNNPHRGFTEQEIRSGHIWLYADVKCEECGKEQSLASVGGHGGKCIKCGGRTS